MHPIIRNIQTNVQKGQLKSVPRIEAGYTVQVSQKIKEGAKERIQKFQGLVIKKNSGEGPEQTITVRKIVEGIGVEKIFPLHSPNVVEFRVIKKAKVRRSKLYYMRDRRGKSARLSEIQVSDDDRKKEEEKRKKHEEALFADQKEEMVESEQNAEENMAPEADESSPASVSDAKDNEESLGKSEVTKSVSNEAPEEVKEEQVAEPVAKVEAETEEGTEAKKD